MTQPTGSSPYIPLLLVRSKSSYLLLLLFSLAVQSSASFFSLLAFFPFYFSFSHTPISCPLDYSTPLLLVVKLMNYHQITYTSTQTPSPASSMTPLGTTCTASLPASSSGLTFLPPLTTTSTKHYYLWRSWKQHTPLSLSISVYFSCLP